MTADIGKNRSCVSSEDATQRLSAGGANTDSSSLLRAENNLLRAKVDILLDTVSTSCDLSSMSVSLDTIYRLHSGDRVVIF